MPETPIPEWPSGRFVKYVAQIHNTVEDRSYMFVLGAGASVSSGIPSGGTLEHL